jgi:nitric oxide reductase subunit B
LLGISEGREYLEGKWPLRGLLIVSLALLAYNLSRTYLTVKVPKSRASIVAILSGVWTLILLYIPTLIRYDHPTVDELAKFLVVHLWEEMSLELIGIGVLAAFLMEFIDVHRRTIEKTVYLDICLIAVGGILATSHHYYWVGAPGYWSIIGLIFSAIQAVPTVILFYTTIKSIRTKTLDNYSFKERITILLIACSMAYHVVGAGLLGLFMAYPRINKYVHGTYMTSAHSHLAVFGVFGFLVLALCFYILLQGETLNQKRYRSCLLAISALNIGIVIMGGALLAAGCLQAYSWRVFNLTPAETNVLIKPYLVIRAVGGWLFAFGSILLTYVVICSVKPHIKEILFSNYAASSFNFKEMKALKCNLTEWIRKQKEVEENLLQVREKLRKQTHS